MQATISTIPTVLVFILLSVAALSAQAPACSLLVQGSESFAQNANTTQTTKKAKSTKREPFTTSNYAWSWYSNGSTHFSFSLKNQSGTDVRRVKVRVLFFNRQGTQIHFEDATFGVIPNGMAEMESIMLPSEGGFNVRHSSAYEKIEILDFDPVPPPNNDDKKTYQIKPPPPPASQ